MFGKLFGKKEAPKEAPKVDPQDAMRKIQESCDIVQMRANVLETRISDLKKEALAKKKAGDQRGALLKMKQIKTCQNDILKLDGQLLMLEQQRGMIESAHFNKQVFQGLDQGKKAVDAMQKDMEVDAMEELQDEIKEQAEKQQELDDVFIKHGQEAMEGLGDELDELEAEMAALEMESEPVAVGAIHVPGQAQKAPTKVPAKAQKEAEEDELEAMMAM